jgi:hypothetical protein
LKAGLCVECQEHSAEKPGTKEKCESDPKSVEQNEEKSIQNVSRTRQSVLELAAICCWEQ